MFKPRHQIHRNNKHVFVLAIFGRCNALIRSATATEAATVAVAVVFATGCCCCCWPGHGAHQQRQQRPRPHPRRHQRHCERGRNGSQVLLLLFYNHQLRKCTKKRPTAMAKISTSAIAATLRLRGLIDSVAVVTFTKQISARLRLRLRPRRLMQRP